MTAAAVRHALGFSQRMGYVAEAGKIQTFVTTHQRRKDQVNHNAK